jgi:hypothetical protein
MHHLYKLLYQMNKLKKSTMMGLEEILGKNKRKIGVEEETLKNLVQVQEM